MRDFQTFRYRRCCFHLYRAAALLARFLENRGFYCLADAVYAFVPLRVCQIGYLVWSGSHPEDFQRYLQKGGAQ